jgi:ribosomal protein S12 methylthiotransferase accessory factor
MRRSVPSMAACASGLTPTSMKLEGLDRHQRLHRQLRKLHAARARAAAIG